MGVLQIFSEFYEKVDSSAPIEPGHLYWIPVPEVPENWRVFDGKRAQANDHYATQFEILEIDPGVHFKRRARLPVKLLNLGETQELLINKAKLRPVIILSECVIQDISSLPNRTEARIAQHLGKKSFLVAPLYSTSTTADSGSFGPVLVARIRALYYPHLFCLPCFENNPDKREVVRLDRVFPAFLGKGTIPIHQKLKSDVLEVLLSQFSANIGGQGADAFAITRELAMQSLPPELLPAEEEAK